MALPPPEMPNFSVQPPQIASPLDSYGKMLQLKALQGDQQMIPLRLQQAQQQVQAGQLENEKNELELQGRKALTTYWSDPSKWSSDDSDSSANPKNDQLAQLLGITSTDPLMSVIRGQIKAGVPAPIAFSEAKNTLAVRQQFSQATADQQKVLDDAWSHLEKISAPILAEKDATKKQQLIDQAMPGLAEWAKFEPTMAPFIPKLNAGNFDAFANRLGAEQEAMNVGKTAADEIAAQHAADPLYKFETDPDELAKPGSIATIQSLINDPKTAPDVAARARPLLADAKVAGDMAIKRKERESQADQIARQGDPNEAGRLLANYSLTLQELKTRGATPQFIQQAINAAQKFNGDFKAPVAEGYAKVADSTPNQQFFGNTDSLLTKGGTLDQLAEVGKSLPQGQLPALNTFSDWQKASLGKGPIAAYAASVLGVADDYAKVMGGAAGSDTSRQQVLDIFKASQSPEQREAALSQVRKQVVSQRRGRIGTNPYLQNMYPEPTNAERTAKPNGAFDWSNFAEHK